MVNSVVVCEMKAGEAARRVLISESSSPIFRVVKLLAVTTPPESRTRVLLEREEPDCSHSWAGVTLAGRTVSDMVTRSAFWKKSMMMERTFGWVMSGRYVEACKAAIDEMPFTALPLMSKMVVL